MDFTPALMKTATNSVLVLSHVKFEDKIMDVEPGDMGRNEEIHTWIPLLCLRKNDKYRVGNIGGYGRQEDVISLYLYE